MQRHAPTLQVPHETRNGLTLRRAGLGLVVAGDRSPEQQLMWIGRPLAVERQGAVGVEHGPQLGAQGRLLLPHAPGDGVGQQAPHQRNVALRTAEGGQHHDPGQGHEQLHIAVLAHGRQDGGGLRRLGNARHKGVEGVAQRAVEEAAPELPRFLPIGQALDKAGVVAQARIEMLEGAAAEVGANGVERVSHLRREGMRGLPLWLAAAGHQGAASRLEDDAAEVAPRLAAHTGGRAEPRQRRRELPPRGSSLGRHGAVRLHHLQLALALDRLRHGGPRLLLHPHEVEHVAFLEARPRDIEGPHGQARILDIDMRLAALAVSRPAPRGAAHGVPRVSELPGEGQGAAAEGATAPRESDGAHLGDCSLQHHRIVSPPRVGEEPAVVRRERLAV
mmetsp:Transcript_5008/g.14730  ORF Transcript_5008/g.14730 Transcript_5008/m.14730 type:complete len:390 (+) Transcript_5008:498-1667(+)